MIRAEEFVFGPILEQSRAPPGPLFERCRRTAAPLKVPGWSSSGLKPVGQVLRLRPRKIQVVVRQAAGGVRPFNGGGRRLNQVAATDCTADGPGVRVV